MDCVALAPAAEPVAHDLISAQDGESGNEVEGVGGLETSSLVC